MGDWVDGWVDRFEYEWVNGLVGYVDGWGNEWVGLWMSGCGVCGGSV